MIAVKDEKGYNNLPALYRVLAKVLLFLLTFVSISLLSDRKVFEPIYKKDFSFKTETRFKNHMKKSSIYFLGDSHTARGFDAGQSGDLFQYWGPNEKYTQTYFRLKHLLAKTSKIDAVLLEFEIHQFIKSNSKWSKLFFWKSLIDPAEMDHDNDSFFLYRFLYNVVVPVAPYVSSLSTLIGLERKRLKGEQTASSSLRDSQNDRLKKKLIKRINLHFGKESGTIHIDKVLEKHFFKSLDLLKDRGIKVYLISYPVTNFFRDWIESFEGAEEFDQLREEVKTNYDVEFLDYTKLFMDEPCQGYQCRRFKDFDHIDLNGKSILSKKILKELGIKP